MRWVVLLAGPSLYAYYGTAALNLVGDHFEQIGSFGAFFTGIVLAPLAFLGGLYRIQAWKCLVVGCVLVFAGMSSSPLNMPNVVVQDTFLVRVTWLPIFLLFNAPLLIVAYIIGRVIAKPRYTK